MKRITIDVYLTDDEYRNGSGDVGRSGRAFTIESRREAIDKHHIGAAILEVTRQIASALDDGDATFLLCHALALHGDRGGMDDERGKRLHAYVGNFMYPRDRRDARKGKGRKKRANHNMRKDDRS